MKPPIEYRPPKQTGETLEAKKLREELADAVKKSEAAQAEVDRRRALKAAQMRRYRERLKKRGG